MKKFKISFLAIIAVLAMSFTVVSSNDHKQEVKSGKFSGFCLEGDKVVSAGQVYFNGTLCTSASTALLPCGSTATGKYINNTVNINPTDFECQGEDNVICCVKLGSVCPGDATRSQIVSVLCKQE